MVIDNLFDIEVQSEAISLPLPPSTNRLWVRTKRGMRKTQKARNYAAEVWAICNENKRQDKTQPVQLVIDVFPQNKRRDLDNFQKALLDSLQGILYNNDKQIEAILIRRYYVDASDFRRGSVQVTVV